MISAVADTNPAGFRHTLVTLATAGAKQLAANWWSKQGEFRSEKRRLAMLWA